jgi:hypothetical protein
VVSHYVLAMHLIEWTEDSKENPQSRCALYRSKLPVLPVSCQMKGEGITARDSFRKMKATQITTPCRESLVQSIICVLSKLPSSSNRHAKFNSTHSVNMRTLLR